MIILAVTEMKRKVIVHSLIPVWVFMIASIYSACRKIEDVLIIVV